MIAETKYIIKSGTGYFIQLESNTPLMTNDPIEATRFNSPKFANKIINKLEQLGFSSNLVQVRFGKPPIPPGERKIWEGSKILQTLIQFI